MPGTRAVINALAATVRVLEARVKHFEHGNSDGRGADPMAECIISTASQAYGMLCQSLNRNAQSPGAAVRAASKAGIV